MGARARLLLLGVLTIVAAVLGTRAGKVAQEKPTETVVALEPVAVPPGIVAYAVLASPDATWRKAQVAIGGVVMLAPPMFGGLLAAFARAPALTGIVDGAAPAYAVIDDQGRWVIAAHVITAARARSTLLEVSEGSSAPPFTVESHANGIDVLRGTTSQWLGLVQTWVIAGSDRDAIVTLGPYAHRTLPTHELPRSALAVSSASAALAGPIRAGLHTRLAALKRFLLDKDDEQRHVHGGRAPDLADPRPLVAITDAFVTRYIDTITAMSSVDVALDVDGDAIDARVTMTPPRDGHSDASKWVEGLEGGSTAPLLSSSADALATIFWRSDVSERDAAAKDVSDTLTSALGARVPKDDVVKLGELFARTANARAGWAMASLAAGSSPFALVRLSTNDAPSLGSSIEGAFDVIRKPTWATWERDALSVTNIERTGTRATLQTEGPRVQAMWQSGEGELDFAVGLDATIALASASPARTLGSDAKVTPWLRAVGSSVVWAIASRPLLVDSAARTDPACLALVKNGHAAELRARVGGVIVRQLITSSGGR